MATIDEATRAKISFENNYRHQLRVAQHIGSVEIAETSDTPGHWFIKVTMRAGSDVYALLEPLWLSVPVRIFETDDPDLVWIPAAPDHETDITGSNMTITGRHSNRLTWHSGFTTPAQTYYSWTPTTTYTSTSSGTLANEYLDASYLTIDDDLEF